MRMVVSSDLLECEIALEIVERVRVLKMNVFFQCDYRDHEWRNV